MAVQKANYIHRDYEVDGVSASGFHQVVPREEREWGTWVETIITAFTTGGGYIFETKAAIDVTLSPPLHALGWVVSDPVAANNGIYRKTSSGATWEREADLPYSFIKATNAGAGTANAIVATSSIPIPSADGGALINVNVTADNTGPVTIAFNGGPVLNIISSSGNAMQAGYLKAGMQIAGFKVGSDFRLLSDAATSAMVALVEQAVLDAQAARDAAQAAASSVVPNIFATKAAAEAYAPTVAPTFLSTAFYDADQVPGSGAKYKKNGTAAGDLVITVGGASVGYDIAGLVVSATSFGLKAANTAAQNMAILKTAIARTPTNGELWVPDLGGIAVIDTPGGLTGAALIDRKMAVKIDGHLKSNYAVNEANPAFIFKVTANGVVFEGKGTLEGDGTEDAASFNGHTYEYPGLIYVSGNDFRFSGVRILKHPKIGIHLYGAYRASITFVEFEGGMTDFQFSTLPDGSPNPAYVGSFHCAIVATGGGDHSFNGNQFTEGSDGGRTVQGIFISGLCFNCKVHGNTAYAPWEKLLYGYGDEHSVIGNIVHGPTFTDAFRLWGNRNVLMGNITDGCASACQVLDGVGNKVIGNIFLRCKRSGVNIEDFSATYTLGISANEVKDNFISWDGTTLTRTFAIRVKGSDRANVTGNHVTGNYIQGFGQNGIYAIDMEAVSPRNANANSINGNYLTSHGDGIRMTRSSDGEVKNNKVYVGTGRAIRVEGGANNEIAGNTGKTPGTWMLSMNGGSGHRFINNKSVGATNIGIEGLSFGVSDNWGDGNQYSAAPLVGGSVLSTVSATTTVSHGGVAPNATIIFIPVSEYASDQQAASGYYTAVSGNDFNLINGAQIVAGSAAPFRYQIIQ